MPESDLEEIEFEIATKCSFCNGEKTDFCDRDDSHWCRDCGGSGLKSTCLAYLYPSLLCSCSAPYLTVDQHIERDELRLWNWERSKKSS